MRDGFDRIVDRRVDVLADELNGDVAAALVRHVRHFLADFLFQCNGNDLVFLLGSGSAHLELAGRAPFDRSHVILRGLVRRVGRDPQHEFVERQHRDRSQVLPVEGNAGRERCREEIRERDDQLVRIALGVFHIEKAFGARAARLVDDDERLLHQIVLRDDALKEARHLIGTAARTRGYDEFDGLRRLPRRGRGQRGRTEYPTAERQRATKACACHVSS